MSDEKGLFKQVMELEDTSEAKRKEVVTEAIKSRIMELFGSVDLKKVGKQIAGEFEIEIKYYPRLGQRVSTLTFMGLEAVRWEHLENSLEINILCQMTKLE